MLYARISRRAGTSPVFLADIELALIKWPELSNCLNVEQNIRHCYSSFCRFCFTAVGRSEIIVLQASYAGRPKQNKYRRLHFCKDHQFIAVLPVLPRLRAALRVGRDAVITG